MKIIMKCSICLRENESSENDYESTEDFFKKSEYRNEFEEVVDCGCGGQTEYLLLPE